MSERTIIDDVRQRYAGVAQGGFSNDSTAIRSIASAFGYSAEELNQLPAEANMGLSCGNPLAMAGIREGEVIVDLGCGGGMDVFLAARKVGSSGRVIGIDMTAEMLERARAGQQKLQLENVEFHQATIDQLPLADDSVDLVISNCVINLVPDKLAVFREILRVLKPGGRVAISDIALKQELPEEVKHSVEAYVGCISGALLIDNYRELLLQAGFSSIVVTDTGADLNAYTLASDAGCCGGASCGSNSVASFAKINGPKKSLHDEIASIIQSLDANAFAASVRVHALKQTATTTANPLPVLQTQSYTEEKSMKSVQIFDKPMCCSTGVCGPDVDPALPKFAADLDWLKSQGHQVQRYNLAQQPQEFIDNKLIHQLLSTAGTDCLPIVLVDGQVVSQSTYPSRQELADWVAGLPAKTVLPVVNSSGKCCGSKGCCS